MKQEYVVIKRAACTKQDVVYGSRFSWGAPSVLQIKQHFCTKKQQQKCLVAEN